MAKGKGRRKGSRNRGYFYRSGRGWYTKDDDGQFVPLEYPNGDRMRDRNTPIADVKAAYLRVLMGESTSSNAGDPSILEVCTAYLAKAEADGAEKTFKDRADTLYDFCFGYPPRFRQSDTRPTKKDRIHKGYGGMTTSDLKPLHIDQWLQAHKTWNGGKRSRVQAVKRALNYGVEAGLIEANPIKGCRVAKQNARVTYITPNQEAALLKTGNEAIASAIKVCIRTGARPGCEFAKLTADHVKDHGDRMEWIFQAKESKTKRLRTIRITDQEIIAIVREQMAKHPGGPMFRNSRGGIWTRYNLSLAFRRTKLRTGLKFDADCCMYSTRHTYAKRTLQGYWTGRQTNIETLARLMGNSPEVCREHYLQWTDTYNEPLWESA